MKPLGREVSSDSALILFSCDRKWHRRSLPRCKQTPSHITQSDEFPAIIINFSSWKRFLVLYVNGCNQWSFLKIMAKHFFNNSKILDHLLFIYVGRIKHISKIDFTVPKSFSGMNFSNLLRLCLDFVFCWKLY